MLPVIVIEMLFYISADGASPFEKWFSGPNSAAAAKVTVSIARIGQGNLSNA
jgi:hypothetical protein